MPRDSTTWPQFLEPYSEGFDPTLFDSDFLKRFEREQWSPGESDRKAAGKLHVQVISRITTQNLGYLDGVEKAALDSIYALFEKTRAISTEEEDARHFNTIAWHVLNTHVRPFTAKWHHESQSGALDALDSTDEFRDELQALQAVMRRFEELLRDLRDGAPQGSKASGLTADASAQDQIQKEFGQRLNWGILPGELNPNTIEAINAAERSAVNARRAYYDLPDRPHATGLALSGGGIRSATFSLGVLVALARRGLLPQFDYLSTVSGGGYLGSFLTAFLNSSTGTVEQGTAAQGTATGDGSSGEESIEEEPEPGLCPVQEPFSRKGGEAQALRHVRHHSRYLAMGSTWGQIQMLFAQLYGLALNVASILFLVALVVLLERWLRGESALANTLSTLTSVTAIALGVAAAVAPLILRARGKGQQYADAVLATIGVLLLLLMVWKGLGHVHLWLHRSLREWTGVKLWDKNVLMAIAAAIPVAVSSFTSLFGSKFKRTRAVLMVAFTISAPLILFGTYLIMYDWAQGAGQTPAAFGDGPLEQKFWILTLAIGAVIYIFALNINFTSPHRHYRNKLAEAYLIQVRVSKTGNEPPRPRQKKLFDEALALRLSRIGEKAQRGPYHLINAALNVPSSNDPKMQGRLTDFFLFSPSFCGSPLTGYRQTKEWEGVDPHLDLGTAMAISGAAAAPQMGAATIPHFRFWLALLNIRLGYWARNPAKAMHAWYFGGTPGLWFLLKEMLGWMDEKSPWLNLSDGGHIENLGVYELLRRRCKYIVAVDGEQDQRMTFAALTTLQRLAAIDMGVEIDINLDDLRLNAKGYSRSHFRFCRIKYPEGPCGYLLYLKLSLTGNEGEFLRRYRLDEPSFPHHSTADQFFSETQFEAYRSLGEHVGDKLFLRAVVGELGDSSNVELEEWFGRLGKNLLQPLPDHRGSE